MGARENILKAADELFGELGFEATSTREIAERSGANKALIHYYFKSKDELFQHVLDQYYDRLGEVISMALSQEGDIRRKMSILLDAYVDFMAANINFSRIVQRQSSGGRHMDRIHQRLLPLMETGLQLMSSAYPVTTSGPLSSHHLFISFFGMVATWFTFSPMLNLVLNEDACSEESIRSLKAHLNGMLNLVMDAIEAGGIPAATEEG